MTVRRGHSKKAIKGAEAREYLVKHFGEAAARANGAKGGRPCKHPRKPLAEIADSGQSLNLP